MDESLEPITPKNMARFSKAVTLSMKDMYGNHKDYPIVPKVVFESFGKRLIGNWKRVNEQKKEK